MKNLPKRYIYPILALLLIAIGAGIGIVLPDAIDWSTAFRPAVFEVLSGRSPYTIPNFFNPPWALLPLVPLALLPEWMGRGMLFVISFLAMLYTTWMLGAKPLAMVLVLLSPPFLHCLLNGNLEWLTCLGFVLPPPIGLFFIAVKPQLGFVVGIFWVVEAWRKSSWKGVWQLVWPFGLGLLLSFAIFGLWPLRFSGQADMWQNASFFPEFVPLGLILVVASLRYRKINFAMAAGPCLSPYTLFHSWIGAFLAVCHSLPETIAGFIGLWIMMLVTGLR